MLFIDNSVNNELHPMKMILILLFSKLVPTKVGKKEKDGIFVSVSYFIEVYYLLIAFIVIQDDIEVWICFHK